MGRNYYYFVTGLPDISPEDKKPAQSFMDLIDEAGDNLDAEDMALLDYIRYPMDNANLIRLIEKQKVPFDPRGTLNEEQLDNALKGTEPVPDYLYTFIGAYRENRDLFPGLVREDQLNWLFYEQMTQNANQFIADWFAFELNLRNFLTGLINRRGLGHVRNLSGQGGGAIICRNDIAEQILRSNAPDFGLGAVLPWADRVVALANGDLLQMERGIDSLRWEVLSERASFTGFTAETVVAFALKVLIVERWMKLDEQYGQMRLEILLKELKAGFKIPQVF